jgi:hypothetical protein
MLLVDSASHFWQELCDLPAHEGQRAARSGLPRPSEKHCRTTGAKLILRRVESRPANHTPYPSAPASPLGPIGVDIRTAPSQWGGNPASAQFRKAVTAGCATWALLSRCGRRKFDSIKGRAQSPLRYQLPTGTEMATAAPSSASTRHDESSQDGRVFRRPGKTGAA